MQSIIGAWSNDPSDLKRVLGKRSPFERVRSDTLRDISKYLGRFREIFAQCKRNGFAYGRGEKYSLELGNDLSRALTSGACHAGHTADAAAVPAKVSAQADQAVPAP